MSQALFDHDVNCRVVGRCSYGHKLDREVGDLVSRDKGEPVPVSRGLGRNSFTRDTNAELTEGGLADLRLMGIAPRSINALDSTEHMDALVRIGQALAMRLSARSNSGTSSGFHCLTRGGPSERGDPSGSFEGTGSKTWAMSSRVSETIGFF
jgi:hypothetical protein